VPDEPWELIVIPVVAEFVFGFVIMEVEELLYRETVSVE
jgi:hypothetical protein